MGSAHLKLTTLAGGIGWKYSSAILRYKIKLRCNVPDKLYKT